MGSYEFILISTNYSINKNFMMNNLIVSTFFLTNCVSATKKKKKAKSNFAVDKY